MAKFGIGQAVRRVEDQRFLLGKGQYVDDISLPGQCHGVLVLSPHAHARIKRIDVSKAKVAPHVLCVLTGADAKAEELGSFTAHLMPEDFGAPKGYRTFQPLLISDTVRFVGDRVAFVVAETLTAARDAAELVEVEYEVLPAVIELEDAARIDGASRLQTLVKIVLPLCGPGFISAGIFAFTLAQNEFLYALIFLTKTEVRTVPVGAIAELVRGDVFYWGELMAGALLGSIPVAFVYSFFVEHYVASLTGSVKG